MAFVYQKKKNGSWFIRFKDVHGRRRTKATKAQTKSEARRLARELEAKIDRQRLKLEPIPEGSNQTLAELCEWWLGERCPTKSRYHNRCRLAPHVLRSDVGKIRIEDLSPSHVENVLAKMEADGFSPHTINGVRGTLVTVFNKARKAGLWHGANPVGDVESRRVPKKVHATLRAEDVPRLLAKVPLEWRHLFATALLTGMRKGELIGLRKADVDLPARLLTIARSYDDDTTKGGHADIIPIADPLVPILADAMARSRSEFVFPDSDGRMRSREADPQKVLRHALARAGLVERYEHTCRRCKSRGTPHVERHDDAELRRCPKCKMKLWPKAIPRQMKFHDLRHTTAVLLKRAGVDLHRIQRILRHRDVRLTADTYGYLEVEDLRAAVNTLPETGLPRLLPGERE